MSDDKNKPIKDSGGLSELNKKILDNAPVSIITIDKNGYITSANKYFDNFSKTKEFIGLNIFASKFFIRENLVNDYKKLLSEGIPVRREGCYEKNNKGEDKYLKIIAVPLWDKKGKIEGALSMAIDNTEVVLFKNKLQELNEILEKKVEQRTIELNEANEELKKALDFKKTFMAELSHEWRTSLTIMQGSLELMDLGQVAATSGLEMKEDIFSEIKRMSAMLADLTLLAKIDSSSHKLNYEKVEVNTIIFFVCKSLKTLADAKNVKIEHKNSEVPVEIMADKNSLEKLILNLAGNAIKYNRKNGWVNIWTEETKDEIILKVEDGGIGIAKKHLPYIFDRFYRANKAAERSESGSGLGLAICKWVAEAHGGKIDVKSRVGQGSLFAARLPKNLTKISSMS